jgi:hypothetical protein
MMNGYGRDGGKEAEGTAEKRLIQNIKGYNHGASPFASTPEGKNVWNFTSTGYTSPSHGV